MEVNKSELPKNSEQWAAIDGYKNYQVSWWGRIRNGKTARILKGRVNPNGYISVNLSKKSSKPQIHYIHHTERETNALESLGMPSTPHSDQ